MLLPPSLSCGGDKGEIELANVGESDVALIYEVSLEDGTMPYTRR